MPAETSVIRSAEQLTDALLEQCQLWREHGWEWWPMADEQPPEGYEWSAPPPLRRVVRPILAQGHGGDFWREVRAEDPAVTGFSWAGRGVPKPLPQSGPHLLAILQRSGQPASPRRLLVAVGLDGMPQADRRQWRKLLKLVGESSEDRPRHVSWINAVRNSQPQHHTPLAGTIPDPQRRPRVPQLYVGRGRASWVHRDVMAQLLIYAYQAEMVSREDVTAWLEGYVRDALPRALHEDLACFLEEVLKTFTQPLDANGLRAHLRHLWQTEQRAGGIDRRLVRPTEIAAPTDDPEEAESTIHDRWSQRARVRCAASRAEHTSSDESPWPFSSRRAAARLGRPQRFLRYKIERGELKEGIDFVRQGRFHRFSATVVERMERQIWLETLRDKLIELRQQLQSVKHGSAQRWLDRQRHDKRKRPREIFEVLSAHPQVRERPEVCTHIQRLIEALGPETGWDA